jgi:hypothetical protein
LYSKYPNTGTYFKFSCIIPIIGDMTGMTIAEMAAELKREPDTVKRQLQRKGIKPTGYAGPTGLYDPSALEAIRNVPGKGRPKKQPEPETTKPAKTPKKQPKK